MSFGGRRSKVEGPIECKRGRQQFSLSILAHILVLALMWQPLIGCTGAEMARKKGRVSNSNKNSNYVLDRELKEIKMGCYTAIDQGLLGKECQASGIARENCALRCAAPACYETVYGADALEEGEINHARNGQYRLCARKLRREVTS